MSTQSEVLLPPESILDRQANLIIYRNITFGLLLIGYAAYYLCRANLSAAYGPMKDSLHITAVQFGWINSVGTLVYALGKVFTGSLADSKRYGGKYIFFAGLFGSAIFSLVFSFGTSVTFFIVVWALNRGFQSMGWGGLVSVMSRWFPKETYGTAMGFMSTSYQLGGIATALFVGYLITLGLGWQSLFVIPSMVLAAIGFLSYPHLNNSPNDVDSLGEIETSESTSAESLQKLTQKTVELSYGRRFTLLMSDPAFLGMICLSFILTLLRECFNVWMPAYFTEAGSSAAIAAFKSTVFPLLGCIGTLFAGWFSDRYLSGRRAPMMAAMLVILVGCLVALGSLDSIASFATERIHPSITRSDLALFFVGATGFFLLGPYSLVAGVVALDFGGRKTAGTAAGLLDGAGYLGATLAGVGVASLVVGLGWNITFIVMSILAAIGVGLCIFLWHSKPRD